MLRTNLATRPFYNDRAVHLALGMVAVVALVVLVMGVLRIVDLSQRNTALSGRVERAEREGTDLSARAAEIQRAVSPQALDEVAAAAREANLLIDQRVFSWTDFFNRIEVTLPPDVMMTEVRPAIEPGSIEVTMGVLGRRLDAINDFIAALEESGAFTEVLERQSEITDDGMYRAVLRGQYLQVLRPGPADDAETDAALSPATPDDQPPGAADPIDESVTEPPVPGGDSL
jgi:Tfp pilus assembly protein PilN